MQAYDGETAALTPEEQSALAWTAIEAAAGIGLFGYFTSGESEIAVASSAGQAVSQAMTDASIVALAASEQESGWAESSAWRVSDLDPAHVACEAADKARRTLGARETEPAVYRAVLEPYAFSEILATFGWSSLNGLAVLEGRSYLAGRMGQQAFRPDFTLVDDGGDPLGLPKAFDFEGTPKLPSRSSRTGSSATSCGTGAVPRRRATARSRQGTPCGTGPGLRPPCREPPSRGR